MENMHTINFDALSSSKTPRMIISPTAGQFFIFSVADPSDCFSSPITTYSGKATTKPGVNQNAHTIVYSDRTPPPRLPGETRMNKDPLRIMVDNPSNKLDPKSRINLSKAIPIDHNHRVKTIGVVEERSLAKLLVYVESVQNG